MYRNKASSFDHLVGAGEERGARCKPERLRGLEVDNKLEFRGLLDGEVAGLCPLEYLVNVVCRATSQLCKVGAVADKATSFDIAPVPVNSGHPIIQRKLHEPLPVDKRQDV